MDICEFYPSITEELLDKALKFASTKTKEPISAETIHIIKHARKSLLFSHSTSNKEKTPWTKRQGLFDVTMGAPDGAEVCELVGLFLLNEVKEKFPELDFGLYRDDGLAAHRRIPGPRMDRIKKDLIALFRKHGLKITFEPPNQTISNYLDVTFDLAKETIAPYRKPNDTPLYVHKDSNHPPNVIDGIPKSINKRLSSISSSEKEFNLAKGDYQKALQDSGYTHHLEYEKPENGQAKRRNKGRSILWYNPPFSKAVKTNLGKQFLQFVSSHFPKGHILHPLLNRNTVKLSYSCTKNIHSLIQSHNTKIISSKPKSAEKSCNCRKKDACPLDQNCTQENVIYHATVEGEEKKYIGSTVHFKKRYYSHKDSFRNNANKNATTLSSFVWEKNLNPDPNIKWSILSKAYPYQKGSRSCDLCLTEKLFISRTFNNQQYLNKRSELALKCRHKARFLLDPPSRS